MGVIAAETRDGQELVKILVGIARGKSKAVSVRDRIAACRVLLDHGWARPLPKPETDSVSSRVPVQLLQEIVRAAETEQTSL